MKVNKLETVIAFDTNVTEKINETEKLHFLCESKRFDTEVYKQMYPRKTEY